MCICNFPLSNATKSVPDQRGIGENRVDRGIGFSNITKCLWNFHPLSDNPPCFRTRSDAYVLWDWNENPNGVVQIPQTGISYGYDENYNYVGDDQADAEEELERI